jgi:hypothetical protein
MKRKFIVDEEINLLAKDAKSNSNDYLNTALYAEVLKKSILNAPENKGFTIGLFGEWGSGKSSIIKTAEKIITEEEKTKGKKVKIITYDAWKYANDSFRRMFLLKMQKDLNFKESEFMTLFYNNKSEETEIKYKVNFKRLGWLLSSFVLLVFLIYKIPSIPSDLKILLWLLTTVFSLLSQFITKIKVFDELKVLVQSPLLFAPEQFEACFDEMVEKSMKRYSWLQTSLAFFMGETHEKNIDQLIIVIDNIDRCHKELAYELLTNIKNFLGDNHEIVFVIPVDDKALKRHISNTSKSDIDCDKESDEFLRKFFNVTIRIKPFGNDEMYEFGEQLNKKYKLGFEPTTISLVSNEFATNPRRIIQIFNNLSAELECLSKEIVENYQSIVCKLLIIREEYPNYYKLLYKSPEILFNENDENNKDKNLKVFLSNTFAVSRPLKTKIEIIESILSNSIVFDEVSSTVKGFVKNTETDNLIKSLNDSPDNKQKVVNYIFSSLKKAIQRKLFPTDVRNYIDIILNLSFSKLLTDDNLVDLFDIIKESETLNQVILHIEDYEKLIKLAAEFDKIGLSEVSDFLVNHFDIKSQNDQGILFDQKDRDGVFLACSILSIKHVTKLKNAFFRTYIYEPSGLKKYDYNGKYEILFEYNLIKHIIESSSLNDNDIYLDDFNFILEKIKLDVIYLNLFIKTMTSMIPTYNPNGDNIEIVKDLLGKINHSLELATKTDLSENSYELEELLTKLDTTTNTNRPNGTRYLAGYINDSIENLDSAKVLINFICLVSVLSKENINITPALIKLIDIAENRSYLNEKLVGLLHNGLSLKRLYGIIIQDENYSSDSFTLLKHAFTVKIDTDYIVPEIEIQSKISIIINHIFEDFLSKKVEITQFLLEIIDDKRVSNIVSTILSAESKNHLLQLPSKVQALTISSIVSRIDDYEDNINVLKLIASLGDKKQLSQLVKTINKLLNSISTYENGLDVILELREVSKTEARALLANIENSERSELQDKIDMAIKHINKIKLQ